MRQRKNIRGRNSRGRTNEQGTVIVLVAVFMLFVVGAMAALSIDVTTMYTARSEAQLVADSAALAAARVLANSGATSDTTGALMTAATAIPGGIAYKVAIQVAQSSMVGGRYLVASEVTVGFTGSGCGSTTPITNPCVSVKVQRTDLPTFFARLLGRTQAAVSASATAEAYNPSGAGGTTSTSGPPVAPLCVKPWILPNIDPSNTANPIFSATGAIYPGSTLLGWTSISATPKPMALACPGGDCTTLPAPAAWSYYPADPTIFQPVTQPTCSLIPTPTSYQEIVAGCSQAPISCGAIVNVDMNNYPARNSETSEAVNCLTHATTSGGGDTVTCNDPPTAPLEFVVGSANPLAVANPALTLQDVMVSDSIVTVPVFDVGTFSTSGSNFQIIGFVQLFLNPDGNASNSTTGNVNTTVINLAGCGTSTAGPAILGNGASPVAVRLISQ